MASVTSLDKDLRNMRLSKYTPQAANEVRDWIEETLQEKLPEADLLEALRDGVALCRLVNLAVGPPGVKFKQSNMPFVQMENISHFLHACQKAPLSLPPHDVFLTVDLYESKDPAQVLQCLGAFSRKAYALQPSKFPRAIGKSKTGALSPQMSGSSQGGRLGSPYSRPRGQSNVSDVGRASPTMPSGRSSTASPPTKTSAWSSKADEATTAPAWNIHQYGYIGGASQGSLGVTFGARRQITTPGPSVPSLAEKEKRRREEEEQQAKREAEEAERQRAAREAEEERAKEEEKLRWEEEERKLREQERQKVEEEKKRWQEEQRQWEQEEARRQQEEKELEERLEKERLHKREAADARLNGQFLSQYQTAQKPVRGIASPLLEQKAAASSESERVKALERELERAKEREKQYELERQELVALRGSPQPDASPRVRSPNPDGNKPAPTPQKPSYDLASQEQERRMLRGEWNVRNKEQRPTTPTPAPPSLPPRDLPIPPAIPPRDTNPPTSPRPLPDPTNYANKNQPQNRTDRFLKENPAPIPRKPVAFRPPEFSSTAEKDEEDRRRVESTQKTRAGGWASKSLLEREMERERERQREWEENQAQTKDAVKRGVKTAGTGPGEGGWDVHQYGYLGGDNQNNAAPGIGFGARRQIIGPRPPP
ncbi:Calponin-Homologuey (CH) domain-containing protein [Trichophyton interdigitale]|nr:Calponin-homology (CH) domain-containing protein [Trichophyton interdigitale]KAG5218364.1 Calponin-homology (CH) domain-containing protein [Trichophyton interdigitale]KAG8206839.1 Calponin-Homologuey (CH) domain-containing protein [Trichophyton interdigitale]